MATRIQTDCHLVQEGTSEKVALVIQYFATFVTGFVLAFVRGPILALALSSILIVIGLTGAMMHRFMGPWNMQVLDAVAKGGSLVEEVVGSVRTAQAFGTVSVLKTKFEVYMDLMRQKGKKLAVVEGFGVGLMCEWAPDSLALPHSLSLSWSIKQALASLGACLSGNPLWH